MKSVRFAISAVLISILFYSCSYTQTFVPNFKTEQSPQLDSIKAKYGVEDLQVQGKKSSGSGGNHTNLTIKLINGKGVPGNDDELTVLAKQVAIFTKGMLKDPKQFESYTVLFVTKTVDGSVTSSKWVGHEFKPGEI
jgi:hypothetical protein